MPVGVITLSTCTQDLACGLFEVKPPDNGDAETVPAGSEADELSSLRVPSSACQTAAMSAAAKAGKTLVRELTTENSRQQSESCLDSSESSRMRSSRQTGKRSQEVTVKTESNATR